VSRRPSGKWLLIRRHPAPGDRAQYAAYDFHHTAPSDAQRRGWQFDDLFEHDFTEYTHSIIWCCYALAWGIEKYDASKLLSASEGVAA
jgi:hypothetical protein